MNTPEASINLKAAESELYDLKDRLLKAERHLERMGYRHCDIPACNCNGYHKTDFSLEIEEAVMTKIRTRREKGRQKYGISMERTDLVKVEWLQHAQEEAIDLSVYLEKLIQIQNQYP